MSAFPALNPEIPSKRVTDLAQAHPVWQAEPLQITGRTWQPVLYSAHTLQVFGSF